MRGDPKYDHHNDCRARENEAVSLICFHAKCLKGQERK